MTKKEENFNKSKFFWLDEPDKFSSLYKTKNILLLPNKIFLNRILLGVISTYSSFWIYSIASSNVNLTGGASFTFSSVPEERTLDSFFVLVTFTTKSSPLEFSPIT